MKKTLVLLTIGALFMGNTAYAATSTEQLIAQLQQQIVALTAKIAELKQAQSSVQSAKQSVNETLFQIGSIREGMTSEQVKLLQATLANDASIYPEGKVTGFYGKLTSKALMRFQKKNGLSQSGVLDAATVALLNLQLGQSSIRSEDNDDDEDENDGHDKNRGGKRFCDTNMSWKNDGHDKGRHKGWEKLVLPRCKHIPGTPKPTTPPATTTPDTLAPVISSITVTGLGVNGSTVTWTTNESAKSKIYLGISSPVGTSSAHWTDLVLQSTHTASLSGLSASTAYYFVLEAMDASGNKSLSAQGSFTTLVAPDVTAPIVTSFSVAPTSSTTATATWTTNEVSSSRVYYSTSTPVNKTTAPSFFDATLVTSHSSLLTGLSASTTYYVVAESKDSATNAGSSSEGSFTTTP